MLIIQVVNGQRDASDSIDEIDPVYHGEDDVMEGEGDETTGDVLSVPIRRLSGQAKRKILFGIRHMPVTTAQIVAEEVGSSTKKFPTAGL